LKVGRCPLQSRPRRASGRGLPLQLPLLPLSLRSAGDDDLFVSWVFAPVSSFAAPFRVSVRVVQTDRFNTAAPSCVCVRGYMCGKDRVRYVRTSTRNREPREAFQSMTLTLVQTCVIKSAKGARLRSRIGTNFRNGSGAGQCWLIGETASGSGSDLAKHEIERKPTRQVSTRCHRHH
jgi:hypothetical protein